MEVKRSPIEPRSRNYKHASLERFLPVLTVPETRNYIEAIDEKSSYHQPNKIWNTSSRTSSRWLPLRELSSFSHGGPEKRRTRSCLSSKPPNRASTLRLKKKCPSRSLLQSLSLLVTPGLDPTSSRTVCDALHRIILPIIHIASRDGEGGRYWTYSRASSEIDPSSTMLV
jgi:hypothetical protein